MKKRTPDQEPSPEHRVVIAAAVTAFLGNGARVRMIRAVNHPVTGAWSRQGRMLLQNSHDLGGQRWVMPVRGIKEP